MSLPPCPFCNRTLVPTGHGGFYHGSPSTDKGPFCFIQGATIGRNLLPLWISSALHYTVGPRGPVLNRVGEGAPVDTDGVNAWITWYQDQLEKGATNGTKERSESAS